MEKTKISTFEYKKSIQKTFSYTFKQPFKIILEYVSNLNTLQKIKEKYFINEYKLISGYSNLLILQPVKFYFSLQPPNIYLIEIFNISYFENSKFKLMLHIKENNGYLLNNNIIFEITYYNNTCLSNTLTRIVINILIQNSVKYIKKHLIFLSKNMIFLYNKIEEYIILSRDKFSFTESILINKNFSYIWNIVNNFPYLYHLLSIDNHKISINGKKGKIGSSFNILNYKNNIKYKYKLINLKLNNEKISAFFKNEDGYNMYFVLYNLSKENCLFQITFSLYTSLSGKNIELISKMFKYLLMRLKIEVSK